MWKAVYYLKVLSFENWTDFFSGVAIMLNLQFCQLMLIQLNPILMGVLANVDFEICKKACSV